MDRFCLHPKSAQKRKRRGKRILFFLPASPKTKKGRQALSAGNGRHKVAEVRAQRLLGGERIRLLCPTEIFDFFRLRAEADETEQKITLKTKEEKILFGPLLTKKFFVKARTQGCLASRAGRKGRLKPNRKD